MKNACAEPLHPQKPNQTKANSTCILHDLTSGRLTHPFRELTSDNSSVFCPPGLTVNRPQVKGSPSDIRN